MASPSLSSCSVFCVLVSVSLLSSACAQQSSRSAPTPQANTVTHGLTASPSLVDLPLPARLSLFGEVLPLDRADVRESAEREWYATLQQSGQLILDIKRARRFFPLFTKVFASMKVPDDVKYLAIAESALYMVRSPKDAVGIWQFIEGTAKQYGLEIDQYVDERRHLEKSTIAAAEFLVDAHQRFGSWCMAAAAYNMGTVGLQQAVTQQKQESYFDLYLNEETSRYIYRIAVIKEIVEHPTLYGLDIPDSACYAPEQTKTERVYTGIDNLVSWAESKGMTYKELRLLNPWILRYSLPKSKNGFWDITLRN